MATDFDISTISSWRHHDAAFVVLLAYACGWTIHPNSSGSLRMFSQDGTQVTVPDNTSLNINVFRSWVGKVWRHRRTTVSPKAFEELVGKSKIDRPHVKIAWTATALEPPTPLPETPIERDDAAHRQAADAVAALVDEGKMPYEAPAIESRTPIESSGDRVLAIYERTMYPPADGNRHGKIRTQGPNRYKKNSSSSVYVESPHVIKREWSDGYIDYACADCGHVSKSPAGIGGHRVTHNPDVVAINADRARKRRLSKEEVQAERDERRREKDRLRKHKARHPENDGPSAIEAEAAIVAEQGYAPPTPAAIESPEVRLAQVARLVFPTMQAEVEAVVAERDAAIARALKAEGDLDALRDLLGVKK